MKLAVASPPIRDFYTTKHRLSALGARAVFLIIRELGIDAEFFNFPLTEKKRTIALPPDLDYLKPLILPGEYGPLSFFTRFNHFGPSIHECADKILSSQPDWVLLSSFAYAYADTTCLLAAKLRELSPDTGICVGGPGPSCAPDYYKQHGPFNLICTGSFEHAGRDLLETLCQYKNKSGVILDLSNSQHALTPIKPASALTPGRKGNNLCLMLTRGCPNNCSFCANHLVHGRSFSKTALAQARALLSRLSGTTINHVCFEDDNILLDTEYLLEICKILKGYGITSFSFENGIDYRLLTTEILDTLLRHGLRQCNFSLGSFNSNCGREFDYDRLERLSKHAASRNVSVIVYFIAGLPGDTTHTIVRTIGRLHSLPVRAGISMYYKVPGLADQKRDDVTPKPVHCLGASAYPWARGMTPSKLVTAFRLSRFSNALKEVGHALPPDYIALLAKCCHERTLYTVTKPRKEPIPVPGLDEEMVSLFFNTL